jgi:DNA repair protein RecN (Recombination protein N)
MLQRLSIQNFALIENVELTFDNGFTVLTGETGSGKSILLGALRLILGERADYGVIRDPEKKTVVEATFSIEKLNMKSFFDANDLDYSVDTIIRREIHAQGKSRAFINDTPVHLTILKEFTTHLIHIHSQHHTLNLKDKSFQLTLLDTMIDANDLRNTVADLYKKWKSEEKNLIAFREEIAQALRENDFNSFQLEELNRLNLSSNDFIKIEEDVNRGEQSEEIKLSFGRICSMIHDENGLLDQLVPLSKMNTFGDAKLEELAGRLSSVKIELQDIASSAEDGLESLEISPEELQRQIDLLDAYNSVVRKHAVLSQAELIQLQEKLSLSVAHVENADEELAKKSKEVKELQNQFEKNAQELSALRKSRAGSVESTIGEYLTQLKLNDAVVKFHIEQSTVSETGIDAMALLFSANKGMAPQSIEKIASGGELSRLMLILQHLMSSKQQLPTVIFDEIDTGVSGEVAQRIGDLLKSMGENMQLLAITHLPQVAGKGSQHIKVLKRNTTEGKTVTELTKLQGEKRVEEVARLMSGAEINAAALENARNLMV